VQTLPLRLAGRREEGATVSGLTACVMGALGLRQLSRSVAKVEVHPVVAALFYDVDESEGVICAGDFPSAFGLDRDVVADSVAAESHARNPRAKLCCRAHEHPVERCWGGGEVVNDECCTHSWFGVVLRWYVAEVRGLAWVCESGGVRPRRGRDLAGRYLSFAERED